MSCIARIESSVVRTTQDPWLSYQTRMMCRNGQVDEVQCAGAILQSHNVEDQTRYCKDSLRLQIVASLIGER